ncbi:Carboxypeptidase A4, partial [Mortierella alpina]
MRLSLTEISLTAVVALSILLSGSSTTTALPTDPINRHPRNFLPPSKGLSPRSFPAPIDRRPHLQPRADPAPKSYVNHRVVRILIQTEEQLKKLTEVEHQLRLDYFSHNKILGGAVDVRVPPESFDKFKALGLSYEILINNLQDLLNVEQDEYNKYQQKWMAIKKTMVESFEEVGGILFHKPGSSTPVPAADDWFAGYHSYDDHTTWLNAQIKNHSDIATGFSAGKTFEGREQAGIKIGKGPNNVVLH